MLTGGKATYAEKLCHCHRYTVTVRRTLGLPVPEFDLIFFWGGGDHVTRKKT